MEPPVTPPYLYMPSALAASEGARYFAPRDWRRLDAPKLHAVACLAEKYAPAKKGARADATRVTLPKLRTKEDYAATKGDILRMLESLTDLAPVEAPERDALRSAWLELKAGHDQATATADFNRMRHRLEDAGRELVPDTLHCNPKRMAGLRDRNLTAPLQHMREVFDASVAETRRGHRELTRELTPGFLKLERKLHMALVMARLDSEIGQERMAYGRDAGELTGTDREARLRGAVARALAPFEAAMDAHFARWREKAVDIPEDSPITPKQTTLGELIGTMRVAKTGEALKPPAELLHHIVAKRAYYFKRDLVKAFDEDRPLAIKVIGQRNRKRVNDVEGENPFEGYQELIAAAYKAKWAATAHAVEKLMQRYEHTLENPAITPRMETPGRTIEQPSLFGTMEHAGKRR